MKQKILLLALVIVVAKTNYAQKTSVGFSAGATLASMHGKSFESNSIDNSKWKPGFTGGIYLVSPVSRNVIFMPALNFVQKGAEPKDLDAGEKDKLTLNYLELPMNFAYTTHGFIVGAGPTVAVGLSGYEKYSSESQPQEKTKVTFGSEEKDFSQIEFGGNLLAGYQFPKGFMVTANYNMGFSNLLQGSLVDAGKMTNNYFALKLAYTLQNKK